jgi:protein-tyrosine phosphatase
VICVVDIHTHVVWDVDDGPERLEESLEILAEARRAGTTDIVATPHLNPKYTFDPELVCERVVELTAKMDGAPRVHRGCEVHLTVDGIEEVLRSPARHTINGTQYLLVELPNVQLGRHIDQVLNHLLDEGLTPIVAHPERNPVLQRKPETVQPWVEAGCLLQLTALSIGGGFGGPAKRASAWLLERGLAHVVASDTHDPTRRHPRLEEAFLEVQERYGDEYAEALFRENPRSILDGIALSGSGQQQTFGRSGAPWWRFWQRAAVER